MVLMIITMGILFSYVRYRLMPVILVGIGLVISLGMMGIVGVSLNMAVIGAFPVLIGLGIDYAIQFHARFDEEIRKGSIEDAVFMTVTRTGPAVLSHMGGLSEWFTTRKAGKASTRWAIENRLQNRTYRRQNPHE